MIPGSSPESFIDLQMLRSHSRQLRSGMRAIVICSAERAASPVQPFFSRCGQSVGKWKKFAQSETIAASHSLFAISSEQRKVERALRLVFMTTYVRRSGVACASSIPVTRTYSKP